jgi:hypothetical protein
MYNRLLETSAEAKALYDKSMKANAEERRASFRDWKKIHGKGHIKKATTEGVAA